MRKRQLNLFEAEVIVFPVDRQVAEVRRAASAMNRLQGKPAKKYWNDLIDDLSRPLSDAGVPASEIRTQMEAFREEVGREMWRQQQGDSRLPGGSR